MGSPRLDLDGNDEWLLGLSSLRRLCGTASSRTAGGHGTPAQTLALVFHNSSRHGAGRFCSIDPGIQCLGTRDGRSDALALMPLNRVINAHHQPAAWGKDGNKLIEQNPTGWTGEPDGTIETTGMVLKGALDPTPREPGAFGAERGKRQDEAFEFNRQRVQASGDNSGSSLLTAPPLDA